MSNLEKLKELLIDVFLIDESEFRLDLTQEETETWDSLGTVSMAVGIEETFGYHFSQEEVLSITSCQDIINILTTKGINFDD